MAFTYDLGSSDSTTKNISRVRKLIFDTVSAEAWYQDDAVQDAIDNNSTLRMAARELILALTANQYFLKNTTRLGAWGADVGSAIKALQDYADNLVKMDQEEPYETYEEHASTDFQYRQSLDNDALRQG